MDNDIDYFQHSKDDLHSFLSDRGFSQPIVILVGKPNASGIANDPNLMKKYMLEDVIKNSNGRVSIFAYTLSPTQFVGCVEGKL
jgi:hypothetical protein